MNKSQILFKVIDVVGEKPQNPYNYDNIYCKKDIAYSDENELNKGDLYFDPTILKDGQKHPIILNIHGGGFVMGDKQYRKSLCEYYATHGYYVYNINYRMAPEVDFFGCIKDSIIATNYIAKLAEEYNMDTSKIVVTGDSTGAYLASYIEAVKCDESICDATGLPKVTVDIASLILHSGPYDMEAMLNTHLPLGIVPELASMLVGYKLKDDLSDLKDYKYYDYISSINFVNDKWCPAFISWSNSDIICTGQGAPMAEKLMECCPKVSTFYANGLLNNHCFHLEMRKDISMQCIDSSLVFTSGILEAMDEVKK